MIPRSGRADELDVDAFRSGLARALNCVALVDATSGGRIEFATDAAAKFLREYFPTENGTHLPGKLVRWLKKQQASGDPGGAPLVIQREEKQLLVKVAGEQRGHVQLLLEEKSDGVSLA